MCHAIARMGAPVDSARGRGRGGTRSRGRGRRPARVLLGAYSRPVGRGRRRDAGPRGGRRGDDARRLARRIAARLRGRRQSRVAPLAVGSREGRLMPAPLVECVPNFSEGRNATIIEALRTALTSVPGVRLLDVQADAAHNRSVFTFVAPPDARVQAALAAMRVAAERIDLTRHTGEHPRMGATDVVPFVPVRDATMDDCVALARRLAERAAAELQIPIYLYAKAATRPERERLPDIRKGEFEGLRDRIGKDRAADPISEPSGSTPTPARRQSVRGRSWV